MTWWPAHLQFFWRCTWQGNCHARPPWLKFRNSLPISSLHGIELNFMPFRSPSLSPSLFSSDFHYCFRDLVEEHECTTRPPKFVAVTVVEINTGSTMASSLSSPSLFGKWCEWSIRPLSRLVAFHWNNWWSIFHWWFCHLRKVELSIVPSQTTL